MGGRPPIPPRKWGKSAGLIIRLQQKPGSLQKVTEYLAERHVSILRAECTRSGWRYATWNMDIIFEDIDLPDPHKNDEDVDEKYRFDDSQSLYPATLKALNDLSRDLRKNCESSFFIDPNDNMLHDPIDAFPHTAISYFHNLRRTSLQPGKQILKPFGVHYRGDGVLITHDKDEFRDVLIKISMEEKDIYGRHNAGQPIIVFAELNSRDMNLRIVPIPPGACERFFEADFLHKRLGDLDKCVGVISTILSNLPKEYNLWRLYNYSKISRPLEEVGVVSLLIEDTIPKDELRGTYLGRAEYTLNRITDVVIEDTDTFIDDFAITPLSYELVAEQLGRKIRKRRPYSYDVFISYSSHDAKDANELKKALENSGVKCFLAEDALHTGDIFSEEIKKAILESRELCILYTSHCKKSEWIVTEWGAFWVLDKRITPVLLRIEISKLPDRLRQLHCIDYHKDEEYARQVLARRKVLARRLPQSSSWSLDEPELPAG